MTFFNLKQCKNIALNQIHKIMSVKEPSYDPFNETEINAIVILN